MPARFLLIDGYNLLHAAGMARGEYGPGELQRCRERLLRYLAAKLSAAEIARTTVVFDARDPPPDRPARQSFRGIGVLFANPGGDADVVIGEWLDRHSAPKRVTLVSSDHALQRAARRNRAGFVDSEEFFDRLEQRKARRAGSDRGADADAKPAEEMTAAQARAWLEAFGDLSSLIAETETGDKVDCQPEGNEAPRTPAIPEAASVPRSGGPRSRRSRRPPKGAGEQAGRPKVSHSSAADDLAYWLELFGDLPEAGELARGKSMSQSDLERWLAEFKCRED